MHRACEHNALSYMSKLCAIRVRFFLIFSQGATLLVQLPVTKP